MKATWLGIPGVVAMTAASTLAAPAAVNFNDHLLPVLQAHCLGCHNADKKKGDLDLSSFSSLMAGGGSGTIVKPGAAEDSTLYAVTAHLADPKMPPKKDRIPDADLALLKAWIEGGLLENANAKPRKAKSAGSSLAMKSASVGKPEGPPVLPEDVSLEPLRRTQRPEAVVSLAASPWAPVFALGGRSQIFLYHTETLEPLGVLPLPERTANVLRFSRNGKLLLAGGGIGAQIGRVVVFDVKTGRRVMAVGDEHDSVLAADITSDHSKVALGGPSKLIKIHDTSDGSVLHTIKKHTDWVTALEFSPDGVLLATGDRAGGVHVWEANTGGIYSSLTGHKAAITDVAWRADSNVLATASEDGQVMLWDMVTGNRIKAFNAHNQVLSIDFAMDGRIVTTGRDRTVRLFDNQGNRQREFESFPDLALQAVFTHDGQTILAGDLTGEVRAYRVSDGSIRGKLSTNPPSLADQLADANRRLSEAQSRADQLASQVPASQQELDKAAAAVKAAQQAADDNTRNLQQAESELAQTTAKLETQVGLTKQAREQLTRARQERKGVEQALSQAEQRIEKLEARHQKLQETADLAAGEQFTQAQQAADEALTKFNESIAEAAALRQKLPAAQQAVSDAEQMLARREAEHAALVKRKSELKESVPRFKAGAPALAKAITEKQQEQASRQQQLAKAQQAAQDAAAVVPRVRSEIQRLQAAVLNVPAYAAQQEVWRLQAELDALQADAEAWQQTLTSLKAETEKPDLAADAKAKAQASYDDAQRKHAEAAQKLKQSQEALQREQAKFSELHAAYVKAKQ